RECEFPSGELHHDIRTRLGADDRVVTFERPVRGPLHTYVRELTIPAHLVRDAPMDARPRDMQEADGAVRFTFGARCYLYDRLGLQLETPVSSSDDDSDA